MGKLGIRIGLVGCYQIVLVFLSFFRDIVIILTRCFQRGYF